jgi:hypothetical protein
VYHGAVFDAKKELPVSDSRARAQVGPGLSYTMKKAAATELLGQVRGTAPFPGTLSPKTKPDRLQKIGTPVEGLVIVGNSGESGFHRREQSRTCAWRNH